MKRILTSVALCCQLLSATDTDIQLNKDLSEAIYETVDLVYANTGQLRKDSLYMPVSKEPEIEMVVSVDSIDATRSKFTLLGLQYAGHSRTYNTTNRILTLFVDRQGKISINDRSEMLLTKKEILDKQKVILQFVEEYKKQLKPKVENYQKELDSQRDKFMRLDLK